MEINDIIADEEDNDCSFVPKAILGHRKIINPRYILKIHENGKKVKFKLIRNSGSVERWNSILVCRRHITITKSVHFYSIYHKERTPKPQ